METVTVGLDIGSSVIRAAEIHVAKNGRRHLKRYAQVGLPDGHVVDGEINNTVGVAAALKRLWAEGGFTTTEVVVGISGPRVFVRQADVPPLSADDLRSSLKFDTQELVPLAMEDASFDFSMLEPSNSEPSSQPDGKPTRRILLVAAHRDLLRMYSTTLKEAGLTATVMDAAPLALLRAVPSPGPEGGDGGMEVIVSIGADLTTVAVRENGIPRFIRSLTLGGAKLTETIANNLHLEMAVAERLKRGAVPSGASQVGAARRAMNPEIRALADEVRATIDFFVTQAGDGNVDRLLITGGASVTAGLAQAIAGQLPVQVMAINPLATLDLSSLPYDADQMECIAATSATAIGLALWPTDAPLIRLSLLPEEVLHGRRMRRQMTIAAGGLAGMVALLGVAGAAQILSVRSAQDQVRRAKAQVGALNRQVQQLQQKTAVHAKMQARLSVVNSALAGDIDWVRVMGQLATVMPPSLNLATLTAARSTTPTSSPASGSPSAPGTITFSVKGNGGLPAVASWLQGLGTDPDFSNVTVTGINITANGGAVTFSSTANLTNVAQSHRTAGANQ